MVSLLTEVSQAARNEREERVSPLSHFLAAWETSAGREENGERAEIFPWSSESNDPEKQPTESNDLPKVKIE